MGSRACARCGEVLSLDGGGASPAAGGGNSNKRPSISRSAPPPNADVGPPPIEMPLQPTVPGAVGVRMCHVCGTAIKPGFRFCGSCGTPVSDEKPQGVAATVGAAGARAVAPGALAPGMQALGRDNTGKKTLFFGAMQASRAKLVLIKGDGLDGISFTLAGEEHQAGRSDVPLLFEEDPYMSPVHANFFYRNKHLVVRDEGSINGVFIRIRGSVPMELGDRFLVGEQVIEVQATLEPGEPMKASTDGTYFYASPRPPSHFRLIQLLRGGDTGLAFQALADVVSLGREGNDINFPDDPFISGHHAQVSYVDGRLSLTDLGSKNGTFLRLNRESVLQHGDYVFMGQQLLRVEIV
jgi:pSer/pThr/pTyr-binding forkhead associated (FHA) protein